jgi:hypothetical protein
MIMPAKHINFSESLLGFGSYVLQNLSEPKSVDELWQCYQQDLQDGFYFAKHSFDNLIMTILFLYSIDAVKEENAKVVKNETH